MYPHFEESFGFASISKGDAALISNKETDQARIQACCKLKITKKSNNMSVKDKRVEGV